MKRPAQKNAGQKHSSKADAYVFSQWLVAEQLRPRQVFWLGDRRSAPSSRALPSDAHGAELPPYSDEFAQDLHLLPFSPEHGSAAPDTVDALFTCGHHNTFAARCQNRTAEKFCKNSLQIAEKRVSYSGILQNANETGRCRGKRTESRRRVQFRTGGAVRDHLSSGCAEERVGADGRPRYGAMKWAWVRLFRLDGGRLCQFGWYREQPRPNGMKAAFHYFRK